MALFLASGHLHACLLHMCCTAEAVDNGGTCCPKKDKEKKEPKETKSSSCECCEVTFSFDVDTTTAFQLRNSLEFTFLSLELDTFSLDSKYNFSNSRSPPLKDNPLILSSKQRLLQIQKMLA